MVKVLTLVLVIFQCVSCANLLERTGSSGYADYEGTSATGPQQYFDSKKEFESRKAQKDIGISSSHDLSETEAIRLQNRLSLSRLEGRIQTSQEKKQYYFYKPMMKNDSERIAFLQIASIEGRDRFAQAHGLVENYNKFDDGVIKLIENNDVAVGMNPQSVRESWGDPDSIDVAGNEIYGNQAWKYTKMISSEDGYKKEKRIIFFESGKVIGWESH